MQKTHIAFVSYPQYPHVGPTLPIVSVMVRRGYRVTYVTSGRFAARVSAVGGEVISCPELGNSQFELAEETLNRITPFYTKNRPELVFYDFVAFAGRILANRLNVPGVKTNPTFHHDKRFHSQQVRDPKCRQGLIDSNPRVGSFLARFGVVEDDFIFHKEELNIYLFPRIIQPCAELVIDERCHFAGRCAGEQPYYGEWKPRDTEGRRVVLVATSTAYVQGADYFKMCIEALGGLKLHIVLSIGDSGDPKALDPLPPHCEIIQHTSHVTILRYASLMICLGGLITTSEALYHGVPLVVTSLGVTELEWQADNLESSGLCIQIKKDCMNAQAIRAAAIEALEEGAFRDRVKRAQHIVKREPGAEETVNRVEDYLETLSV